MAGQGFQFSKRVLRLRLKWSGREDSNLRPPAPEAGALPGCATPRHTNLQGQVHTIKHLLVQYKTIEKLVATKGFCGGFYLFRNAGK
jgi:hypothetical protein